MHGYASNYGEYAVSADVEPMETHEAPELRRRAADSSGGAATSRRLLESQSQPLQSGGYFHSGLDNAHSPSGPGIHRIGRAGSHRSLHAPSSAIDSRSRQPLPGTDGGRKSLKNDNSGTWADQRALAGNSRAFPMPARGSRGSMQSGNDRRQYSHIHYQPDFESDVAKSFGSGSRVRGSSSGRSSGMLPAPTGRQLQLPVPSGSIQSLRLHSPAEWNVGSFERGSRLGAATPGARSGDRLDPIVGSGRSVSDGDALLSRS